MTEIDALTQSCASIVLVAMVWASARSLQNIPRVVFHRCRAYRRVEHTASL